VLGFPAELTPIHDALAWTVAERRPPR
jgi:hypothetical protein